MMIINGKKTRIPDHMGFSPPDRLIKLSPFAVWQDNKDMLVRGKIDIDIWNQENGGYRIGSTSHEHPVSGGGAGHGLNELCKNNYWITELLVRRVLELENQLATLQDFLKKE